MRHEDTRKIDRYLDQQLGLWTRLLPWRCEIAVHLEQAYQAAQTEAPAETLATTVDDDPWQKALAEFGNVQDVASQLRREHWPQYLGWRIVAVAVSALIVFSNLLPAIFLDLPALGFTLGPLIAFAIFDAYHGSIRWELASRVGTWGALCGAILGLTVAYSNMADPSNVGKWLAVSILSALYCVLFFTPRRPIVVAMMSIAVANMGIVVACFLTVDNLTNTPKLYLPGYWIVDNGFMIRVLAICGAGVCAGIARFGFHGVAQHAPSIGAGTFLISLIVQLGNVSDPSTILPHLLVAFGAMALAVAASHCVSDSSRAVRRLLS